MRLTGIAFLRENATRLFMEVLDVVNDLPWEVLAYETVVSTNARRKGGSGTTTP
jgi:anti-sigma factor RsiW